MTPPHETMIFSPVAEKGIGKWAALERAAVLRLPEPHGQGASRKPTTARATEGN
jgi:hypothetical protein